MSAFSLCLPALGARTTTETLFPTRTGWSSTSYLGKRKRGPWFPASYRLQMFLPFRLCHSIFISFSFCWPLRVPWAYLNYLLHTWVESDLCKTASHHVKTAEAFGSGQNCPNKTPEKWPKWKLISQRGAPPGTFQECTPLLQKHRPYRSVLPWSDDATHIRFISCWWTKNFHVNQVSPSMI